MGCFGYICPKCKTQIVGGCWGGGEECILIHVREGKELGRVVGHYGEYGNVLEDEDFRSCDNEGINGHSSICKSEMDLPTSVNFGRLRELPSGESFHTEYGFPYKTVLLSFIEHSGYKGLPENAIEYVDSMPENRTELASLEDRIEIYTEIVGDIEEKEVNEGSELDSFNRVLQASVAKFEKIVNNPLMDEDIQNAFYEWIRNLPISSKVDSGIIAYHKVCYDSLPDNSLENLEFSMSDPDQSWGNPRAEFGGTPSDDWEDEEED